MKILLMSMGTRGDMEPFLALAELLQNNGNEITIAMPAQFEDLVHEMGFNFYPFDKRFMDMLDSPEAKNVMGQKGSIFSRFKDIRKLFKEAKLVQHVFLKEQWEVIKKETPDKIIFHPKIHMPFLWGKSNPGKALFLFPMPHLVHPLKHAPTIPLSKNLGQVFNLLSFKLFNFFTVKYLIKFTKDYHHHFPDIKITNKSLRHYMLHEAKSMIMITRAFFTKPNYWNDNVQVLGYRERDKTMNWKPSDELLSFLEKYPKVLFITFGSMPNANPEKPTKAILSLLEKHKIPTIINTFKGGLMELEDKPEYVFYVNRIPYDWVFPKCYAVIHHGGSGTLHMATQSECPSLVVPHAMDQFFWNKRVAELKLGPLGISIKKLSEKRLEPLLLDLWNNPEYKENARSIGRKIKEEDYEKEILEFIQYT